MPDRVVRGKVIGPLILLDCDANLSIVGFRFDEVNHKRAVILNLMHGRNPQSLEGRRTQEYGCILVPRLTDAGHQIVNHDDARHPPRRANDLFAVVGPLQADNDESDGRAPIFYRF